MVKVTKEDKKRYNKEINHNDIVLMVSFLGFLISLLLLGVSLGVSAPDICIRWLLGGSSAFFILVFFVLDSNNVHRAMKLAEDGELLEDD